MIGDFLQQAIHLGAAHFLVSHFAATMKDHGLHLMAFAQKLYDLVLAHLVVVLRGCRPELDFLELRTFLVLALLVRLFVCLVQVLTVVGYFADGRVGSW